MPIRLWHASVDFDDEVRRVRDEVARRREPEPPAPEFPDWHGRLLGLLRESRLPTVDVFMGQHSTDEGGFFRRVPLVMHTYETIGSGWIIEALVPYDAGESNQQVVLAPNLLDEPRWTVPYSGLSVPSHPADRSERHRSVGLPRRGGWTVNKRWSGFVKSDYVAVGARAYTALTSGESLRAGIHGVLTMT